MIHIFKVVYWKEVLFQKDLVKLIGERPFDNPTTYQEFVSSNGKHEKEKVEEVATSTAADAHSGLALK